MGVKVREKLRGAHFSERSWAISRSQRCSTDLTVSTHEDGERMLAKEGERLDAFKMCTWCNMENISLKDYKTNEYV